MYKLTTLTVILTALLFGCNYGSVADTEPNVASEEEKFQEITGTIEKGETFFDIFKKYNLDISELFGIREAAAEVHKLRELRPGRKYTITVDDNDRINSLSYNINDDAILNITRTGSGFNAEKQFVEYEKEVLHIGGVVKDNLISSIGEGRENLMLALKLSDIFAWDIDFNTDLRNGDIFKIVTESLSLDGTFRKYGEVLSVEFTNNGKTYHAYRYEVNGKADYFDDEGKSVKKAFLKAPLSFRRISSTFSKGRYHPVLKIYRPHHGLDYAAPSGTPVSSVGDGSVIFAGRKGQYGNLVIVKHRNGYRTSYGHLSRIAKNIRNGRNVDQGQIIGYVGATGLATGPHLHYEVRINNKPVNPLTVKMQSGEAIPKNLIVDFMQFRNQMVARFASINPPVFASAPKMRDNKI